MGTLQKDEEKQNKEINRKIYVMSDAYYVFKKYFFKFTIKERQRKKYKRN